MKSCLIALSIILCFWGGLSAKTVYLTMPSDWQGNTFEYEGVEYRDDSAGFEPLHLTITKVDREVIGDVLEIPDEFYLDVSGWKSRQPYDEYSMFYDNSMPNPPYLKAIVTKVDPKALILLDLEKLILPESMRSLSGLSGVIDEIVFPENLCVIEDNALGGLITSTLNLYNTELTYMGSSIFCHSRAESLILPPHFMVLDGMLFDEYSAIYHLICTSEIPYAATTATFANSATFSSREMTSTKWGGKVYVPEEYMSSYANADGWKDQELHAIEELTSGVDIVTWLQNEKECGNGGNRLGSTCIYDLKGNKINSKNGNIDELPLNKGDLYIIGSPEGSYKIIR